MWFGHKPQINFCHFFFLFCKKVLSKCIDNRVLVDQVIFGGFF